jgi:hypothetical protein
VDGDREAFGMWVQFRRDLGKAAAVLVGDPLLPALTAVLAGSAVALGRLGHGWTVLVLPLDLFLLGFAGTQRVWFLRGFRFRSLDPDEIWSMTLAFIPRFLLLSLVTGVSLVAAAFVLRGLGIPLTFASHATAHRSLGVLVAACLLADVALTFVTPALALSVHSWREALHRGLRMLGETWPASAPYALTPGIAIFVLSASAPPKSSDGTFDVALVAAAGAVLALWLKGAIVAFYVRRHPGLTDGGAAYAGEPVRRPRSRA